MPIFLVNLLLKVGIGERYVRPMAYLLITTLLVLGVVTAKFLYDRSVIREHESGIVVEVREKTDKGNAAATEAANTTKADVEEGNRRASDAAKDSADPLRDGLRELRK